jgi:beta-glucosidase
MQRDPLSSTMNRRYLPTLVCLTLLWHCGGQTPPAEGVEWPRISSGVGLDASLEAQVTSLLARMTLEQKVGQMVQAEIQSATPADVRTYHLGSVLNGGGSHPRGARDATVADWLALADAFYAASMDTTEGRLAIPVIWGTDAVHGHNNVIGATLFPHNIGLGATRNPDLIHRIGEVTALEVAATGLGWNFAPTLAVVRNDRWGRTYEGYSEDPEIVAQYAGRMIEGLQGKAASPEFLGSSHVIATAKHFIGDGGTDQGVDRGDNLSSEQELLDIHAQGYLTALAASVQTVMASFNSWQGTKLHGSHYLLTEVLKERLGFDGFVIGDWNGHGEVPGCSNDSCPDAINAGVDMIMVPQDWQAFIANTVGQVQAGEIDEGRIDDAVRRILRVKGRAGLFTSGPPSSRTFAGDASLIGAANHRRVARQAVRESLVLLKNAGGLLPLPRNGHVLIAGEGADQVSRQTGGWSITWQGTETTNEDFPGATSVYAGIAAAVRAAGGRAVLRVDGSFDERPDVAIVVFGEGPYAEMFGDLESLSFSGEASEDLELLRRLKAEGIPVVSVFLSGRPRWVNPELNASTAFVAAWLPGTEGGGVADVLFRDGDGEVNFDFTGKLSYSWPRDPSQTVLNRHDSNYEPLFPYGFGLTYSVVDTLPDTLPEVGSSAAAGQ